MHLHSKDIHSFAWIQLMSKRMSIQKRSFFWTNTEMTRKQNTKKMAVDIKSCFKHHKSPTFTSVATHIKTLIFRVYLTRSNGFWIQSLMHFKSQRNDIVKRDIMSYLFWYFIIIISIIATRNHLHTY